MASVLRPPVENGSRIKRLHSIVTQLLQFFTVSFTLTMFKKIIRRAGRVLFLIAGVIEARVKPANIQINYFRTTQTFGQKTNGICIPFPLQLQKVEREIRK